MKTVEPPAPDSSEEWDEIRAMPPGEAKDRRRKEYFAWMHPTPGAPIPDWWEVCPVCRGAACTYCDDTGHIHPKRGKWLDDQLPWAWMTYRLFLGLVERHDHELPRLGALVLSIESILNDYLQDWVADDPTLQTDLDEIEGQYAITPAIEDLPW